MKLYTPVVIEPMTRQLTYGNKILAIGSCFAAETGKRLYDLGFDITLNPFGVLYNPASIEHSIRRLAAAEPFTEEDVVESQGVMASFFHHGSFSRTTAEEFLENANDCLQRASKRFEECDTCLVTLGTSWTYRHIERDMIVSNCHKIPAREFRRELLSPAETESLLGGLIRDFPDKRWIFSVSPIRHLKDTAHGNQTSKASLLLAVDALEKGFENVEYFPAYEIMMDELRDYRFYAEDLVHPSKQAVDYIFERFVEFAVDPSQRERMQEAERALKASAHRPNIR